MTSAASQSRLAAEVGVFCARALADACEFFDEHGLVTLRGLFDDAQIAALQRDCEHQQGRLVAGELPEKCGTVILDDPDAVIDGKPFAHYVCHITEVSEVAR